MRQATGQLEVKAERQGLHDVTRPVADWVEMQGFDEGLLTLFCRHTSASLLIQENAAPQARLDLELFFARIAPQDPGAYSHDDEGPDDMPAHLRSALTRSSSRSRSLRVGSRSAVGRESISSSTGAGRSRGLWLSTCSATERDEPRIGSRLAG